MLEETKYLHRPHTIDLHTAQEKGGMIYDQKIKINSNNLSPQNKEKVSVFRRFHELQNYRTKVEEEVRIKYMKKTGA